MKAQGKFELACLFIRTLIETIARNWRALSFLALAWILICGIEMDILFGVMLGCVIATTVIVVQRILTKCLRDFRRKKWNVWRYRKQRDGVTLFKSWLCMPPCSEQDVRNQLKGQINDRCKRGVQTRSTDR